MVEAHRLLRASREHVFALVAHAEHLPRYGGPLWLAADLEDRRGGEPLITLRGYFAGLPVESVIRAASRPPQSVDIAQVRGTLRGFSQRFRIESDDEGTVLSCRVEADPGIPMLSDEAAKHFLIQYVERMLDRLRLAAERRTPSRRPARSAARDAVEAGAETAAGTDTGAPAIAAAEPAAADSDEATAAPRPAARPLPSRVPRPPRFGRGGSAVAGTSPSGETTVPQRDAAAPSQAAGPGAASPELGRRRRRRRRRRGRGGPGAAAAGDAPSQSTP